jgi:hypothetical protein
MAVIVRETMDLGAGPQEVAVFLPKRPLSKREREQAERLDGFLRLRIPEIAAEMRREGSLDAAEIRKWHALGRRLAFVQDAALVAPDDVVEGHVWGAIRQYCPPELRPSRRGGATGDAAVARREGTRLDHYYYCYLLGKQDPAIFAWLARWSDWFDLVEIAGALRDARALPLVVEAISRVGRRLGQKEFREFVKELRKVFSTKPVFRDTTVLDKDLLADAIATAIERTVG